MNAAALTLTRPDPQQVFPWGEPGSAKLLAVAPQDVERWRVKLDYKRIRFVALHEDWQRDARFQDLIFAVREEGAFGVLEVIAAVQLIGFELCRNHQAMGLQAPGSRVLVNVAQAWGLGPQVDAVLRYAVVKGLAAGLFWTVSPDDSATLSRFCATLRRGARKCAVDASGAEQTGTDKSERGPGPALAPEAGKEGRPGPPVGNRCHAEAVRLSERIAAIRSEAGLRPWPASWRDAADLVSSVRKASERGERAALEAALCEWATRMKTGGGFHSALRDEGWL